MKFEIHIDEEGVLLTLDDSELMIPILAVPYVITALASAQTYHLDQQRKIDRGRPN